MGSRRRGREQSRPKEGQRQEGGDRSQEENMEYMSGKGSKVAK